jgi:hypothetical protein
MEKSKKEFEDKSDAEEKVIFHVFEGDHSAEIWFMFMSSISSWLHLWVQIVRVHVVRGHSLLW